ncbi:phosphotransferase-like protein [Actinomadura parmotrematis]|uniref:Guanylate kinase n=1 Tax=Actinomadura parmotrematis TaxID=2864039 RepID=A0ABS7G4D9_9ACTN|nr:guanylate kinase [Actinomadura parmotrematis]MBW8487240.1 guanylate kinase [Actinomadura parmotrematis]
MTPRGVILYGPPASGKDTITAALAARDERFVQLTKLKVGSGRSTGYRYVSAEDLAELRDAGRLVVETERYGNRYAVDRNAVDALTEAGYVPVIHAGSVADARALTAGVPLDWVRVELRVPREVCAERSRGRGDVDTAARLRAWDEAADERERNADGPPFDLTIRTDQAAPDEAARQIIDAAAVRSP